MLVVIEGLPGSGKTTLIDKSVSEHPERYQVVREGVHKWVKMGLLQSLMKDPKRHTFLFQVQAALDRQEMYQEAVQLSDAPITLMERSPISEDGMFVRARVQRGDMTPLEEQVYHNVVQSIDRIPVPDLTIVLECSPEVALERIRKRDREGESAYDLNLLRDLKTALDAMMFPGRVERVACREDAEWLIDQLYRECGIVG